MKTLLPVIVVLLLAGWGGPASTPCLSKGSGLTASHNCRHRCLSRWAVSCPDGNNVTPNTCSGVFACSPGSCPEGQVCYHDTDPFDDRSFCIAADTCGNLSAAELQRWEVSTVAQQNKVIAARLEKEARRQQWRKENPDKPTTSAAQDAPATPE